MPTVSVIVPNYNHAAFLEERINSILGQTYEDYELIIMDDKSSDHSLEIIQQYRGHPKVSNVLINEQNSGSTFIQWEKGIQIAKGDFIWIAESDDFAHPTLIEKLLPLLQNDPSIALAYAQSQDVDQNGNFIASRLKWTTNFSPNIWNNNFIMDGNDFINHYHIYKNVIPNASAVIFRKETFKQTYDPIVTSMKMAGDWLLWISMIAENKIAFLHETLNYFREHQTSTRVHDTRAKKMKRLVEESFVLKKVEKISTVKPEILKKQYQHILKRWFKLFPRYTGVLKKDFYTICDYIQVSRIELIVYNFRTVLSEYFLKNN